MIFASSTTSAIEAVLAGLVAFTLCSTALIGLSVALISGRFGSRNNPRRVEAEEDTDV